MSAMRNFVKGMGHCVARVNHPNGESRVYGPFVSGEWCIRWMDHQYDTGFTGGFIVEPLRTPDRERDVSAWWDPESIMTDDHFKAEFVNWGKESLEMFPLT
jgi:hypothetical protein